MTNSVSWLDRYFLPEVTEPLTNAATGTLNDVESTYLTGDPVSAIRFTGILPTITGIASGTPGRRIHLLAVGGPLVIANESASSAAANRIVTGTDDDVGVSQGAAAWLVYDDVSQRWRLSSGSGGGGGGGASPSGSNGSVQTRSGPDLLGVGPGTYGQILEMHDSGSGLAVRFGPREAPALANTSTGAVDNVPTADANGNPCGVILWTGAGAVAFQGIAGGVDGRRVRIINASAGAYNLELDNAASATPNNKIRLPFGASTFAFSSPSSVELTYAADPFAPGEYAWFLTGGSAISGTQIVDGIPASKVTSGQLTRARGGTGVDFSNLAGQAGKAVLVNAGGTAFELGTVAGGGGGGFTPPSGTGFAHVSGGALDSAATANIRYASGKLQIDTNLQWKNSSITGDLAWTPTTSNKTLTLPDANDTLVGRDTTDTFTNKTISGTNNTLLVRIGSDVTGLGTGVSTFLGTPSGANFAAMLTSAVPPSKGGLGLDASALSGILKFATGTASVSQIANADVDSAAAIAYSKMGVGTQSIGAQQFNSTVDSYGTEKTKEPVSFQTTDATVTTLDSFTLASNTSIGWTVCVKAIKSDSSQAAFYTRTAAFRNNGGTVAQIGTTQPGVTLADDPAWACTIDNSGTSIRVRITGKAATTIRWTVVSQRLEVIP